MSTLAGRVRRTVGVDVGASLNLVGALLKYFSLAFLFPVALALGYSEPVWPFVLGGAITAVLGYGMERLSEGKESVSVREGFLVVALTWLLAAAVVSLHLLSDRSSSRGRSTRTSRPCRARRPPARAS